MKALLLVFTLCCAFHAGSSSAKDLVPSQGADGFFLLDPPAGWTGLMASAFISMRVDSTLNVEPSLAELDQMFASGLSYIDGTNDDHSIDFCKAAAAFDTAARRGHTPSRFLLSLHYSDGLGVNADYDEASLWATSALTDWEIKNKDIVAAKSALFLYQYATIRADFYSLRMLWGRESIGDDAMFRRFAAWSPETSTPLRTSACSPSTPSVIIKSYFWHFVSWLGF